MRSKRSEANPTAKIFLPILTATCIVCLTYMYFNLMRGWVPHDEGALAHAAERVLEGELSHRDFDDRYTGGLALLHAASFWALGTDLASMRWVMFLFFAAWVPAIYYLASRFVSPLSAAGVTLLAVAWSVPNYASPIPSWYNLFFAVFGIAALSRYLERPGVVWLFVAGMCGGLSCLAKITGLYYIASALLFFVFREQTVAMQSPEESSSRCFRSYSVAVLSGLVTFLLLVLRTVEWNFDLRFFVHFELPSLALVLLLVLREIGIRHRPDKQRLAVLLRMMLPFLAGVLVPIIAFLIPYAMTDSVQLVIRGVFISPQERLLHAVMVPGSLHLIPILAAAMLLALLYDSPRMPRPIPRRILLEFLAVFVLLAVVIVVSSGSPGMYQVVWSSVILLIPIAVLAGSALLLRGSEPRIGPHRRQQVFILLSSLGVCSLIQFPFSAPIYFCYVAPLLALAVCAVIAVQKRGSPFINSALSLFYISFAVLYTTPGFIYNLGFAADSDKQIVRLDLPRGGDLRVSGASAAEYQVLIPVVQSRARSQYIYAAPDCPEVYFLSGLRNPTKTLFDFLDEPSGRTQRIMDAIDSHDVNVAVLLQNPDFSPPVSGNMKEQLELRFPKWVNIGRFQVRWRE